MSNGGDIVRQSLRMSVGYMMFTAVLAIIVGIIMLFYPGGTMRLMETAFVIFQIILSVFILGYTISEAAHYLRSGSKGGAVTFAVIGVVATALIWLFSVKIIFIVVALFLILAGAVDIAGGIRLPVARYFLIFLGLANIMIGIAVLVYPTILPFLIAWYALFWGMSRLFLSLELRKMTTR
jgi:hypothetical protein